jgi:heme/copper-type cytochrome/quinol oxidase subunit 4
MYQSGLVVEVEVAVVFLFLWAVVQLIDSSIVSDCGFFHMKKAAIDRRNEGVVFSKGLLVSIPVMGFLASTMTSLPIEDYRG